MVLHEIGELNSTHILGPNWKTLITECAHSRVEIMLRAAKDILADTISTLPVLIKNDNRASIHFYAANMSAMRKELCPSFMTSYKLWDDKPDPDILDQWVQRNATHWQRVLEEALDIYSQSQSVSDIQQHFEINRL